ncbi:transposase family protein [Embleya sp. NPDC005971]|uniref:transposase family protein n=1 Tax=Embleya sp. NPDC005971 TaxID=3156724 RepID=UPI0033DD7FC9
MLFVGDEPRFWDLVWPDVEGLEVDAVETVDDVVRIDVHSRQPLIACPACGSEASRVHSSYERRVADRPLGGRRVVLRLRVCRGVLLRQRRVRPPDGGRAGRGLDCPVSTAHAGSCPDRAGDRSGRGRPGRFPAGRVPAGEGEPGRDSG